MRSVRRWGGALGKNIAFAVMSREAVEGDSTSVLRRLGTGPGQSRKGRMQIRVSDLRTTDIWVRQSFAGGRLDSRDCLRHRQKFIIILGLYTLEASSTPTPHPNTHNQKCFWTLLSIPVGVRMGVGRTNPAENR